MLGAIYIGLSGLNAYSKGLQTISNNVANLNSPGFKATSVSFSDVFSYGGLGSNFGWSPAEQGGDGVRFDGSTIDFRQGDLRQSENDLDLAIQGGGFLVLLDGQNTLYSRTGQFAVDDKGYVSDRVTGYQLAVLDSTGRAVAVNIADKRTSPPVATTTVTFSDNLSTTATEASVSNIAVYDSRGGKQVWKVQFQPVTGSPGQWKVTVTDDKGAAVGETTLKFIGSTVDPTTSKLTINASPAGADPLSVVLDFSKGVTSFSTGTVSSIRASKTDGNAVGTLASVTVAEDGQVKLTYTNEKTEELGYVALADFRNPQELERLGNGAFRNRGNSDFRLLRSGADGGGRLLSRQIEASNVDLSQQFGDLILIQRGFQASSQVVSVSNDMIQQLFGMRGQG
ncbi:MAG TPA: flagellar hook-basal body complex protein [Allosphingosinicella sp.]|jgi:flagellar hook protein FlgE